MYTLVNTRKPLSEWSVAGKAQSALDNWRTHFAFTSQWANSCSAAPAVATLSRSEGEVSLITRLNPRALPFVL